MPPAARILETNVGRFPAMTAAEPPETQGGDSDVVVILAALLCALICVVGLAAVARCAWARRASASSPGGEGPPPPPNKGLKKKALRALPKTAFDAAGSGGVRSAECAICLAEFEEGEEIRILPHCGHAFHVACVDTWLGSHSSCPSCRRVLVVPPPARCHVCGSCSAASASSVAEGAAKAREDGGDAHSFLP